MAINLRNYGVVEGRLAADPKVMENRDGSKKVFVTVYADNNFKSSKTNKIESQRLQLEAFVSNKTEGLGVFAYIHQGDLVAFSTHLEADTYEKNGETVYAQKAVIDTVEFRESRSTTQARLAQRAVEAAGGAPAPAADQAPAGLTIGEGEESPFQG